MCAPANKTQPNMTCKICGSPSDFVFRKTVLGKYPVAYFRCRACRFIQTEHPHWLAESYESAITSLDIGLVERNIVSSRLVSAIIRALFNKNGRFIDYGGGYGLFVRLMRDRGFDFYRQDRYCENLFSKNFDVEDANVQGKHELLTAFELFEHLEDPLTETAAMLEYADNILFSTELQPADQRKLNDWWYVAPETGQHIAFYTPASLKVIAQNFGLHLCSVGTYHLLSRKKQNNLLFGMATKRPFQRLVNGTAPTKSLLQSDFAFVRQKVNDGFVCERTAE